MFLHAAGEQRRIPLGERPLIMGIVNASPDSFSDGGLFPTHDEQFGLARQLKQDGADLLDIGGETALRARPAISADEEIRRIIPLIERASGELGLPISVDTYKPAVARAAIAAGAAIINDVSGLRDPEVADICAESGAGLVIMHTRVEPKGTLIDPHYYADVVEDALTFFDEKIQLALDRGVALEQIVLDPGPDFAKTRAQTVEVLRGVDRIKALGRPILWAVSRKGFIGAITKRSPEDRLSGTLAALAFGVDNEVDILRMHDVAAAADFLKVTRVLRGEEVLPWNTELLPPALRAQ